MTTATQIEIQTQAAIESLINPIDQLAVVDRQVKDLTALSKTLKDTIANTYGECSKDAAGKVISHRGEKYGATVSFFETKTVDKAAMIDALISDEIYALFAAKNGFDGNGSAKDFVENMFTKTNAVIRVTSVK
jgi:hypothetical protein